MVLSLGQLGWRAFFSQQLTLPELEAGYPARVLNVQRNHIALLCEEGQLSVVPPQREPDITVGDWMIIERHSAHVMRLLERQSVIARLAAGSDRRVQPIAANLDTVFVVTSCNDDFNLSRLERYLTLIWEAQVEPVIVLTKSDLCTDAEFYVSAAHSIAPRVRVLALDATSCESVTTLAPWLDVGRTVAFIGSSGVGKSTLINTIVGGSTQITAAIRDADAKGRHTTTSRQMLRTASGAWVIDTPGMRELKIGAVTAGLHAAFDDIEALARTCRYRDCAHATDAGCAVRSAVADGSLDDRRLRSYLKLRREAANAARTMHERRERERHFGRICKTAQQQRRRERGRW